MSLTLEQFNTVADDLTSRIDRLTKKLENRQQRSATESQETEIDDNAEYLTSDEILDQEATRAAKSDARDIVGTASIDVTTKRQLELLTRQNELAELKDRAQELRRQSDLHRGRNSYLLNSAILAQREFETKRQELGEYRSSLLPKKSNPPPAAMLAEERKLSAKLEQLRQTTSGRKGVNLGLREFNKVSTELQRVRRELRSYDPQPAA